MPVDTSVSTDWVQDTADYLDELRDGLTTPRGTDFYLLEQDLPADVQEVRDRVRSFVDDEVLPVINDYWERAEFPYELLEGLAATGVVGAPISGYGCPGLSRLAQGVAIQELSRGDGSMNTFLGASQFLPASALDDATIASASGCSDTCSTAAPRRRIPASSKPSAAVIAVTDGLPSVRVPVLSTTRVSTFSSRSSASAFLISTPARAPLPTPTMIDIGVARPSAQGQAMISTDTATTSA